MPGKALVNFADFVKSTNLRSLTNPDDILNDAVNRTYGFFNDMLLGRGVEEVVRGGERIKEVVQLKSGTQFQFYRAGETFSPYLEDTQTTLYFDWRFAKDAFGWTDQETMLNEGEDQKIQFKRLKKSKQQACYTSMYNGMEAAWISSAPVAAAMETQATATDPYCMRAFITEGGGAPGVVDGAPVAWLTIAGVDPTTELRYTNQVESYTAGSIDTTLLKSFRNMWRKLKFKKPRTKEDFFKDTNFKKTRILTDATGQEAYERILTEGNDSFTRKNDAGFDLRGPGVPRPAGGVHRGHGRHRLRQRHHARPALLLAQLRVPVPGVAPVPLHAAAGPREAGRRRPAGELGDLRAELVPGGLPK